MRKSQIEYYKKRRVQANLSGMCQNCFKKKVKVGNLSCEICLVKKRINLIYSSSKEYLPVVMKMIEKQNGKCAICEEQMSRQCFDHDHITNKLRGILCNACNTGVGFFRDNPNFLKNAANYLEKSNTI